MRTVKMMVHASSIQRVTLIAILVSVGAAVSTGAWGAVRASPAPPTPANPASATSVTRYTLDPAKSTLEFQFVQAGAQNKGKFGKFPVTLSFSAGSLPASKLDVVVEVTSLDTGDQERDDTLRGPDLFGVTKFPQAHFTSTQITQTATGYDALGKLTLHGVTRDEHVAFSFRTAVEQGQPAGYLTGKTSIKRLDFGIGQGDWKSTEWVGNDVTVSYSLRLVAAAH